MGIFALSTLLVAGAGIYLLSKVFPNFQPGDKKIQADFQEMQQEIEPQVQDLLPLSVKDAELLASEEEDHQVKKSFTTSVKGKLITIFHEPVVLYRYKKYLSTSGKDAVLYARSAQHQFFYWIKPKGTKIVIDNSLIGTLENGENLLGGRKERLLARLDRQRPDEYISVLIGGREVATLLKAQTKGSKSLTTRAFGFVQDELGREEFAILFALTIYELLMRHLAEEK